MATTIYNSDQIMNLSNVELIQVNEINDYKTISLMKKEKFKWIEVPFDGKFVSFEDFAKSEAKYFVHLKDGLYINVSKIVLVEREKVENTIDTFDVSIHLNSGEPFVIRGTSLFYELMLRRMREG